MKSHILVVDDEPVARQSLTEILRLEGYNVSSVPNGQAAVEYVRKHPVDLVIVDLKMPGMDGLEVIQVVNQISPETDVGLLTLSALRIRRSKRLEGAAQAPAELLGAALGEVQLRLLDQVQVDRLGPQVAAAALDLVAQERAAEAVHAVRGLLGIDEAAVHVGARQVVPRRLAARDQLRIDAQVAGSARDDDLVAPRDSLAERALERGAEAALGRLHAVRERRDEQIDAAAQQLRHRRAVEHVVDAADLAAPRAECQRREPQQVYYGRYEGESAAEKVSFYGYYLGRENFKPGEKIPYSFVVTGTGDLSFELEGGHIPYE